MNIKIIDRKADHKDSMEILKNEGLKPLTYQEALAELIKNAELKEKLKGKWFYLAGRGLERDGLYRIENDGSFFRKGEDIEKTIRVRSGDNPLSLGVRSDVGAAQGGGRFDLGASGEPYYVAPVVVGKPRESTGICHRHRFVCECGKVA